MAQTRRSFLKLAGAAGIAAAAGPPSTAVAAPAQERSRGPGRQELPRQMTFCTLRRERRYSLGVRTSRGILEVERAARLLDMEAPMTIDEVFQGGDVQALKALVHAATSKAKDAQVFVDEATAPLGPCVTNPEKIICIGFNYRKHAIEVGVPIPTSPVLFNKFNNALNHHQGVINLPQRVAFKFDYEVELVIVLGRVAREVSEADALSYVFGYCTGNDFTARDLQSKTTQYMIGKTCDGFAPVGPWLVTADQIPDPQNLTLECAVNGQIRQSSNTNDMIFSCATLVSYISQHMTLKPGDIIFTGTPQGVINGYPPDKQMWLKPGDEVVTTIEKLGQLRFTLAPQRG